MATPTLTELLDGTWFVADLPPGPRARLAGMGRVVDIPGGALVVQKGTVCRARADTSRTMPSVTPATDASSPTKWVELQDG